MATRRRGGDRRSHMCCSTFGADFPAGCRDSLLRWRCSKWGLYRHNVPYTHTHTHTECQTEPSPLAPRVKTWSFAFVSFSERIISKQADALHSAFPSMLALPLAPCLMCARRASLGRREKRRVNCAVYTAMAWQHPGKRGFLFRKRRACGELTVLLLKTVFQCFDGVRTHPAVSLDQC